MNHAIDPPEWLKELTIESINLQTSQRLDYENFEFPNKALDQRESGDELHVIIDADKRIDPLFRITQEMQPLWEDVRIEQCIYPYLKLTGAIFSPYMQHLTDEVSYGESCFTLVFTIYYHNSHYWYKEYLGSEDWRLLRNRILGERGFKCELCPNRRNLQLHHITYENLGQERDSDLIILCESCHKKAHS